MLVDRAAGLDPQWRFLSRFVTPSSVLMEIGSGDCALARLAAGYVERVYAVGSARDIGDDTRPPVNLRRVTSDGVSIPVPPGSVHVCVSDAPIDLCDREDARARLRAIYRALASRGVLFCRAQDDPRALRRMLREIGFSRVRLYAGAHGFLVRVPFALIASLEMRLELRLAAAK